MSLVKDYFPDAPDVCLSCPTLIGMASEIDTAVSLSIEASTQSVGTDSPTLYEASQRLSTEAFNVASEKTGRYCDLAAELIKHCQTGTIPTTKHTKILRRQVVSTLCGSSCKLPDGIKGSWKEI